MKNLIKLIVAASLLAGCSTSPTTESRIQTPTDVRPRVARRALEQPQREIEFRFVDTRVVGRSGTPSGTRLSPGVTSKPKHLLSP